ncbi:alpha/beta hydrolase fold domain-containing protein [Ancylobacter sonchi]|uniref:alpha/beta hydrolase n=1 Tax=Ancylobacter sonchi TaxID=1937790 RepID=UPI001BD22208|nr:alpha/beta hydrolase [Ancylobacter sonchi]MBS7536914.1 alpha/beta hydrolase fold domain-containing protein [Ancylobacter sonchi]
MTVSSSTPASAPSAAGDSVASLPELVIDPSVFAPSAVSPETRAVNAGIVKALGAVPDRWVFPMALLRKLRLDGKGPFPLAPESPYASVEEIDGPHGPVALRIYTPPEPAKGVYLHIHGGGWCLGSARENDGLNHRLVERTGFAVVSVDYRLAPEAPWPAAPDDCEAAALWLVREGKARFGTEHFVIGGESAGANLSVATLLRLRDRHGLSPFRAANLNAGCYDLGLTPSARNWGDEPLVLNTRDINVFVGHYLREGGEVATPDISPLHGDLRGLPPALFTIGTRDALLDDTLFMAPRWLAAGNRAEIAVYPGGCHVFIGFPGSLADKALARIVAFLAAS